MAMTVAERARVAQAIDDRDSRTLNYLAFVHGLMGEADEFTRAAALALWIADPATQAWWSAPCDDPACNRWDHRGEHS